jgi:hypothetical protein
MLQIVLYLSPALTAEQQQGEEEKIFLIHLYQAKNPFETYFVFPNRKPSILNYFCERRRRKKPKSKSSAIYQLAN